jgi:anaerobic selenocysteine-containing dehydrogenase
VSTIKTSICRNCLAFCPILVTLENGRPLKVTGDPEAPLYDGYTCPKGRALPEQHNDPERLLRCLKLTDDGGFAPIASGVAVEEVMGKVTEILDRYGPRSIAMYVGTGVVTMPTGADIAAAWFKAIGSRMIFSASTIDKPAGNTAPAMHGNWVAGAQPFESADTWMIVGANPVISKSNGAPCTNPGQRLKEAGRRGMKLIVIDPRRTETARRAHIHLQAKPGEDPTLLAGMINVILREGLYDAAFVGTHARGLETLRTAVASYTPEHVAERAGVPVEQLLDAARTFGGGKRGGVVCATGPSFSTYSNLTYYLAMCLNTLCGRWAREGDKAPYPNMLLPPFVPKAQPYAPYPVFGEFALAASGLKENASGLPTAALPDEMLTDGDGRVRVLFCLGGNPMLAWPDQARTEAALKRLDLLVVFDYQMTATAHLADYVIASPLSLEIPAATYFIEALKYFGVSRGFSKPWAQYTPAVAEAPSGSDLMDDREFFFRMAQGMGLQLEWVNRRGFGRHLESATATIPLDMTKVPEVDELIALSCANSRVPLDEVKRRPHGYFDDVVDLRVEPRDPACAAYLELADPLMIEQLAQVRAADSRSYAGQGGYRYRLVCRRENNFMNSVGQALPVLTRGKPYNPAAMHPEDLAALGLEEGSTIRIRSAAGAIAAIVESDDTLRPGVVSITHGFGARVPASDDDPRSAGSAVTRLVNMDEFDPITGIPRMSAIPVAIEKWGPMGFVASDAAYRDIEDVQ